MPDASPDLGLPAGLQRVHSRRGRLDKEPWRDLPPIEESVDERFLHPLILGESIVPFRQISALQVIVPWDGERLLDSSDGSISDYPGLSDWWAKADPAHRVVYTASGSIMAACRVSDPTAVIDQKLYWATVTDQREALYLSGIFNTPALKEAVAPLQSRGQFGTRDFDKYVFQLWIPQFDPSSELHQQIADLADLAETLTAALALAPSLDFKRLRKQGRDALVAADVLPRLDAAVRILLDGGA